MFALELIAECARRRDRQCGRKREDMFISRDELCALARSEGKQMVVIWIGRTERGYTFGILDNFRELLEDLDEPNCVFRRNPFSQIRASQRPLHLVQQRLGYD